MMNKIKKVIGIAKQAIPEKGKAKSEALKKMIGRKGMQSDA